MEENTSLMEAGEASADCTVEYGTYAWALVMSLRGIGVSHPLCTHVAVVPFNSICLRHHVDSFETGWRVA